MEGLVFEVRVEFLPLFEDASELVEVLGMPFVDLFLGGFRDRLGRHAQRPPDDNDELARPRNHCAPPTPKPRQRHPGPPGEGAEARVVQHGEHGRVAKVVDGDDLSAGPER